MLWYKAWLETRLRFLICLIGITWLCVNNIARAETGVTSPVNVALYYSIQHGVSQQLAVFYVLAMNLTTMGGLLREKAVGAASFTLALPFSRARLAGVRIATAFSQALALIVIPWAAILIAGSVLGKAHLLQQALFQLLLLTGGGVVYFAIALLASCLFEGEYTALVVSFGVVLYTSIAQPPGRDLYNPVAFMTGGRHYVVREGLLTGPVPWGQVAVYGLFSLALVLAAIRALQVREF